MRLLIFLRLRSIAWCLWGVRDPLAFNALWAVLPFVSKQVTLLKEFTQSMCKSLEILDTINKGLSKFAKTLQSQNSQTYLFSATQNLTNFTEKLSFVPVRSSPH